VHRCAGGPWVEQCLCVYGMSCLLVLLAYTACMHCLRVLLPCTMRVLPLCSAPARCAFGAGHTLLITVGAGMLAFDKGTGGALTLR
jgi:hypothetical protein